MLANNKLRVITTSECNLDCFYCHNEGQAKGHSFITLDRMRLVAELAAEAHVEEVTLSGGEPLLHPRITDIVSMMRATSPRVTIVSNGVLLTREMVDQLVRAGVTRFRLGVDSLDPTKPRPSPGFLSGQESADQKIAWLSEAGVSVELNVVLTHFSRRQVLGIAELALDRGLSAKFFEHVDVQVLGLPGEGGVMTASPHIGLDEFAELLSPLGVAEEDFQPTPEFGVANVAVKRGPTELRYCKYLCPFGLCWVTGTRVDADGFIYQCMTQRGLDRVSADATYDELRDAVAVASRRHCPKSAA